MDDSILTGCTLEGGGRKRSGEPKRPRRPQTLPQEDEEEGEEGDVEQEGEEEDHHRKSSSDQYALLQRRPVRMRGYGGGEIVEVEGGHIVRSIGRKDRHSKVCTAKGPRDRRVRLSAHTAIQFYDVQDRLGYDRPSKAVDWLIKNAKAAIDELAELPPWHPIATAAATAAATSAPPWHPIETEMGRRQNDGSASASHFAFGGSSSSFLPPSLESDAIADTIKFFFPIQTSAAATETGGGSGGGGASIASTSSANLAGFHHQQYPHDILSQSQDLRLSLQSFQDPIHHHQQQQQPSGGSPAALQSEQSSFFDAPTSAWSEPNQRIFHTGTATSGVAPYMPALPHVLHPVLGQNPFFSQRGPLQSNNMNSPSFLAWTDPASMADAMHQAAATHGFASSGLSRFRVPARIQGEEEEEADDDDDDDDCEYEGDEEDEEEVRQVGI